MFLLTWINDLERTHGDDLLNSLNVSCENIMIIIICCNIISTKKHIISFMNFFFFLHIGYRKMLEHPSNPHLHHTLLQLHNQTLFSFLSHTIRKEFVKILPNSYSFHKNRKENIYNCYLSYNLYYVIMY